MSALATRIRPAEPGDVAQIVAFIRDLAQYERLGAQCHPDADALAEHLFGPAPSAEVLLAEVGDEPAGFALFFPTYSTFRTQPGIWLEDLFVVPEQRGQGVGRGLLGAVAQRAVDRGCGRVEWAVLDWNAPAIGFYTRLGARLLEDWTICRVEGTQIAAMSRS